MKRLENILEDIALLDYKGRLDKPVQSVGFDSRTVDKQGVFVAINGLTVDGHEYIDQAIAKGATTVVCQKMPSILSETVTYLVVADSAQALGQMASNFYDNPSHKLKLIGITGTNGKTTSATLLYHLFLQKGFKTGLISTIANYINGQRLETKYTTPDAIQIQKLLGDMVNQHCEYAFMEVSSHALKQGRIYGLKYDGALFTNITHEHLDYHKTFDDYLYAKKLLFDHHLHHHSFALINGDDKNSRFMVQNTPASVYSFGLKSFADFKGKVLEKHIDGTLLHIDGRDVWTQFVGTFNAYNLLGVYATAKLAGYGDDNLLTNISKLQPVEGRFETIHSKDEKKTAIVDYAHSPDALENVLLTIQSVQRKDQKVITVVGAGGDRDKQKRPQMTQIALQYSHKVVLTSDNPRMEDPEQILVDMKQGLQKKQESKMISIANRKEAIRTAWLLADHGDILLVAGKGHETYQEIQGVRYHFDDREIIKELMNNH
jgi:UDP-N-acetylmuramoyl-L-alanyl-D-glutamate--2,6-diaminopimelate ligase